MSETCKAKMPAWASRGSAVCGRDAVPGFDECWRHASVEEMAAKIVDLTGQIGALRQERDEARLLAERYQAERGEAQGALLDLQRWGP